MQVKSLVTLERLADVERTADDMDNQFANNDIVGMHRSVSRITKYGKTASMNTSTRVANQQGEISQTYREERLAFREHFISLMKGEEVTFSEVVRRDRFDSRDRYGDINVDDCWQSIPSPTDCVTMGLNAKTGKAPGENRVIGKVHKFFVCLLLRVYFPLILKTFARVQPPIQYKGGMIYEIYKNKGPQHLCASFRDVLLANDSGKHVCKHIRRTLLPSARKLVHCTQFGGGFNGGETAFTHLYARCAIDALRSQNVSSGILFLDVVTAFACMLRRSIFPNEDGDEMWLKSLRNMGFSESDIKAIYETVSSLARWDIDAYGNLLSSHDGSDKLAQMLAKHWYTHTWMTQEGLPGAFITNIGCMAGTPLADLAFTISISRILYILRKTLYQDDLESHVIINGN